MKRILSVLAGTILAALATTAHAQSSRNNPSCAWGCVYGPSTTDQQLLRNLKARDELQMQNGGAGGNGGSTTNNYNGPVNNTYTGPMSSSGSTVTNVQNLSEIGITSQNSNVSVGNNQSASGGTQSGNANANAATQGSSSAFNPGSNQSAHSQ